MTARTHRPPLLLTIAVAVTVAMPALLPALTAAQSSSPMGTQPATQPAASGTLTVGLAAEAESLDPYLNYQNAGISVVNAIFDTLVSIDREGHIGTGGLAESWSFPTATTLEFKLRPGIVFHDGSPFTADDVKFSIDRVKSDALASQLASNYGSVSSVTVVDPLTVRLDLSRPDASLIASLGTLAIVSKRYHDAVGDAGFASHPVGTGPLTFREWVKDDHLTLAANPAYWSGSWKGWPLAQTVTFRPIPDAGTRLAELTTGGVDIMADLPADQISLLTGSGASSVYLQDGHHVEIWLNSGGTGAGAIGSVAKDPTPEQKIALEALAKPEVRTALNMAIDRATIIDTLLKGYGSPLTSVFGAGTIPADAAAPAFPYDPAAARQMLAAAGYPNGFSVDLDICTCDRSDTLEAVAAQLADIGVNVTLKPFEVGQFNDDWGAGRSDPMRASRLGFPTDQGFYLSFWVHSGGVLSAYANPAVDALIDQQAVTMDPIARDALLAKIAGLTHADPAAIYLWNAGSLYGKRDGVSWQPHVIGYVPVFGTSVSR
jgi:peptide/nickel transport system substrate-binding protein